MFQNENSSVYMTQPSNSWLAHGEPAEEIVSFYQFDKSQNNMLN